MIFTSAVQAESLPISPIIAAPASTQFIPDLNQYNGCSLIPLGGYGVNSSGTTYTVQRYCDSQATELQPFLQAGWGGANNCTPYNSSYTHPADTCNAYWPHLMKKLPECPIGYTLVSGKCNPTGKIISDKNLGPGHCIGNPINAGIGMKYQVELDMALSNWGMKFERVYNSQQAKYISNKVENKHWQHNYERQLVIKDWLDTAATVIAVRPNGKNYFFSLVNNLWSTDSDIVDHLTELKDSNGSRTGWSYSVAADDSTEIYDTAGKLQSIVDLSGYTQTLTYSDASTPANIAPRAGLPIRVTDNFGRQLNFTYDTNGRLSTLTDPAGGLYQYAYDAGNNLSSVTYPDDTPADSADNPKKTYVYGELAYTANVSQPYALTGIIDENNKRYATFTYDAQGRAIATEHAGGADKYTLSYSTDGTGNPISTTITDPLNSVYTQHFQTVLGVVKPTGSDQPAGSGCDASASALTYDANGNVASRTDFNGNRSCYAYNSRNLETVRIEGMAPGSSCPADLAAYTPAPNSSERKISTDWHATFRLPVKLTEPGLETTYSYDDKGQVTHKSLKDLNTLQTRSWTTSYTYATGSGLLLSKVEDGPRTDVSDLTTYDYYPEDAACTGGHFGCRGQLQQVTDALGHVTQISRYSAHGQPEELTDPNGLVTTLAYDARQRLTSLTVGDETTSYRYDPAGLLTRVTGPDGAYLAYSYDDAHRLTGIQDQLGNTVTYTLDALGNRLQEDVRDPTGQLARTQSRVYDALSRLQNLVLPE
jgi:YD repeat-containing protein